MSASTMAKQGEKTKAKVLAKVGKRPKSANAIAAQVQVIKRGTTGRKVLTTISAAMARIILKDLSAQKKVVQEKQGREWVYRLPTVADVPKDALAGVGNVGP